jgi:hypothetical protein
MKPRLGARALPDFLIIGAQKSATTSLLAYIGAHVDVRLGVKKTAHFFDLRFDRGVRWYARHFPHIRALPFRLLPFGASADREWLTGESCPSYMFLAEVPGRVREVLPDVKIIAILRDPVDRLISQYLHEHRKNRAPDSFEKFIAPSRHSEWPPVGEVEYVRQHCAVPRGFYEDQLRHWLKFFPANRLCTLSFEELVQEPTRALNRVFSFLGLASQPVDTSVVFNRNMGKGFSGIDSTLRTELAELYRRKNAGLEDLVGRPLAWCRSEQDGFGSNKSQS